MPPNINDLMYAYFGRTSSLADAQYAYYLSAYNSGVTGNNIVNLGYTGAGSPNGVVTAPVGSMYRDTTNGVLYLKATGAGNTGWLSIGGTSGSGTAVSAFVGTGSDGVVNFDGTNTFAAFTSTTGSAPNLVYTLTRDVYASSLTVANGITVITGSFRVLCNGTVTVNGTLQNNGLPAGGVNNATGGLGPATQLLGAGGNGANGAVGAGTTGSATTSPANSATVQAGGAGGVGGTAGGTAGGVTTTGTAFTAQQGGAQTVFYMPFAAAGQSTVRNAIVVMQGACGGSSGAGDSVNAGGGGGGGGGVLILNCLTFAGNGSVQSNGGAGGTPTTAGVNKGVGGGGGGGGGLVMVNCHTDTFSGSCTATGGAPGTGLNGSGGTGAGNGVAGASGTVARNVV